MGVLALALTGCGRRRPLNPSDFAFVTTNTTLQELVQKVRYPDRHYLRTTNQTMITSYEWDLTSRDSGNRYVMLLKSEFPLSEGSSLRLTSRVQAIEFVRRPVFIDFSTNRKTRDEDRRP